MRRIRRKERTKIHGTESECGEGERKEERMNKKDEGRRRRRMKSSIFRDITPCSPIENKPTFRKNMSFLSSGSKNRPSKEISAKQVAYRPCYLFHSGLLPALLFNSEDEGDMFLRNDR
jgi:hypothetical protein